MENWYSVNYNAFFEVLSLIKVINTWKIFTGSWDNRQLSLMSQTQIQDLDETTESDEIQEAIRAFFGVDTVNNFCQNFSLNVLQVYFRDIRSRCNT